MAFLLLWLVVTAAVPVVAPPAVVLYDLAPWSAPAPAALRRPSFADLFLPERSTLVIVLMLLLLLVELALLPFEGFAVLSQTLLSQPERVFPLFELPFLPLNVTPGFRKLLGVRYLGVWWW